jgi:cell division protein FtsL
MINLMNVFAFAHAYSVLTVAAASIIGFAVGFLLKWGIIAVHKKRIIELEEEMLSNHSKILELEKQNGELKSDISELKSRSHNESKLKVS